MKTSRLSFLRLGRTLVLGLMALWSACSKPGDLGLSLIEQSQADILYTDTISFQIETVPTLPMESMQRNRFVVGAVQDPVFGYAESWLHLNFRITSTNVSFTGATLDSIVFSIAYDTAGHYGQVLTDPQAEQTWQLYRMNEPMETGRTYYADQEFALGQLLADDIRVRANFYDSIEVDGVREGAQLRVRLDPAFGQELLNPADLSVYSSNNNFKEFFKGICLRPKAGAPNNSLIRFWQRSRSTRIVMYYSQPDGTGSLVSRRFTLQTDEDSESVLRIRQDYSATDVLSNRPEDSLAYLQGLNGLSLGVRFPHLASMGNILVNKAELWLYPAEAEQPGFPFVRQIVGATRNETINSYELIRDVSNSLLRTSSYQVSGGTLSRDEQGQAFYRLNLSMYLQDLIRGKVPNNLLYLQTATITNLERVILANERHTSRRARFVLTYTRLD